MGGRESSGALTSTFQRAAREWEMQRHRQSQPPYLPKPCGLPRGSIQTLALPAPFSLGIRATRESPLTWPPMPFLHPDVAVALGNSSLGVQEGEAHAALSAEAGIVAVALLHGILVVLLPEAGNDTEARVGVAAAGPARRQGPLPAPPPMLP